MKNAMRVIRFRVSNLQFPISRFHAAFLLAAHFTSTAIAQAPATTSKAESLLSTADEVLKEMSEITGLPIKGPLKKLVLPRSEIRKFLEQNLHDEYTPLELHQQEALLKAFGLVSGEFDLEKFLITFYTEQAAGAYDPRRKTMFIADWPTEDMQRLILSHELTHALQDQNFDLVKFLHAQRDNDDATSARQAIMEGHATAAMMQHMVGQTSLASLPSLQPLMASVINQQFAEYPAFSTAPYFFRLQALFPYVYGMNFIQMNLQHGGWKGLADLFANPPSSTKEIFDPEFYFAKETVPEISLPRPPMLEGKARLRVLGENTFGQLGYYSLLGQLISEDEAKKVSPGWLGDRYVLYEGDNDRLALVARTRWSGPESALEFFRDYYTILGRKYPGLNADKRSSTDLFVGTAASGQIILLRKGDECRWAEGIPAAQTDAMLAWLRSL